MQDPLVREIVNHQEHTCEAIDENDEPRTYTWVNTNKLLGKGFNGLKTGVTPMAGPCLAASFERGSLHFIIIVLYCKTMDNRWVEVPKLCLWAINRLTKISQVFGDPNALAAASGTQDVSPSPEKRK
jgi:D-alanyl-D-alanine carboxypeptidase